MAVMYQVIDHDQQVAKHGRYQLLPLWTIQMHFRLWVLLAKVVKSIMGREVDMAILTKRTQHHLLSQML